MSEKKPKRWTWEEWEPRCRKWFRENLLDHHESCQTSLEANDAYIDALQKENENYRLRVKELRQMYDHTQELTTLITEENAELKETVLKLHEAVEFYGKPFHWYKFRQFEGEQGAIDSSDWDRQGKIDYCGGKRARQAIEETREVIEKIKGE